MALFLSTFENKIDKKGRVSVPASFRASIAKSPNSENFNGIIVYPSFVNESIEACGFDRIEQISKSIDNLDPYSEERDAFAATILGDSVQLSFDNEGRVIIPENLLKIANLEDTAIFVGKGQNFEIWHPSKYKSYIEKARIIAKEKRGILK
ncbi:MAG: division/cell wall cluster transcriptional repressor MraZ [Alphaproteobacteria bacterium]|jgi:MraZ protein